MAALPLPGPALPWGAHPTTTTTTAAEEGSVVEGRKLDQVGLTVGSRIEVHWDVEVKATKDGVENSTMQAKWWGAKVVGPCPQQQDDPSRLVHDIWYDKFEDQEEEGCKVCFLTEHLLQDLSQDGPMHWRREGEDFEVHEDGGESGDEVAAAEEGEENGEGPRFDSSEILQATSGGLTMEQEEQDFLDRYPPDQQRILAAGVREFSDKLVAFLKARAEAAGDETYVVTREEIEAFRESSGVPASKRPRF